MRATQAGTGQEHKELILGIESKQFTCRRVVGDIKISTLCLCRGDDAALGEVGVRWASRRPAGRTLALFHFSRAAEELIVALFHLLPSCTWSVAFHLGHISAPAPLRPQHAPVSACLSAYKADLKFS